MKKIKLLFYRFYTSSAFRVLVASYLIAIVGGLGWQIYRDNNSQKALIAQISQSNEQVETLSQAQRELDDLKNQDPYVENEKLKEKQDEINLAFNQLSDLFELRADVVAQKGDSSGLEPLIAEVVANISEEQYASASSTASEIKKELTLLLPTPKPVAKVASTAPLGDSLAGDGYSRVAVTVESGTFTVAAVVAPGARAVVETASDSDCADNCPTKSLAEHVASSGGFAGINGAYFCPPDYPRCQGKVNSFDTLAVNGRSKAVLNRDNNVYSTIPLVAMYGNNISFYDQTLQWGIDTGSNGAIANFPRLVRDGQVANSDENGKGTRGFIGVKDGAIVIGHVFSASYGDTARVLTKLGLNNAMNLDGGGSSALYLNGSYYVGPGRSLPTAIVLIR